MQPISFEFFPPKTEEQRDALDKALPKLKALAPEYVSVTFGAGGSTLDYTVDTVAHLRDRHALDAAPHISCMGGRADEIRTLLDRYVAMGCTRIVALRGDMPSGMATMGEFRYASDLVAFIRRETGAHFHIEVACYPEMHPQADNLARDLDNLKRKLDAGADGAITQYFYNTDAYFRFIDDARRAGITAPIVPGVMPIANFSQLKRFSDGCGAEIPRWIEKRMLAFGDDVDAVRELGADVVAELCRRLRDGGAGAFHFYTLNRARATLSVIERL
ncbi:MAG TPA: methylenetetrahydrofolate reductase [NAD(P)H] [Candidatus Saccharimonadia bacterium]|nr:methylenetetrahydrofolate reductase [NAD(P)H] [Candidatus Saccharimonadia bacterium]